MRDIQNDKLVGKKTMSARMGLDNSKFYHFLLISISIILMVSFLIKEKSCSLILTLLTFVNIIWLVYDLYRVYKIKDPKEFDFFLKPLVLATVFYSISLSINFAYLI
tara:strand:- start:373 stop:693 length:321 start_codon:yes stop_codon:yes gene_type:complete